MVKLQNHLGCGKIYVNKKAINFVVQRLSSLTNIIIPLFDKYPIKGNKVKDYEDFKLILQLMNSTPPAL